MPRPLPRSLQRDLRDLVGADHLITDPGRLVVYDSDGLTAYHRSPRAVVLPGSTDELVRTVQALHGAGIAVVPRGAGTGLSGGALPDADSVVVGTARLSRILSLDPANRVARVQPGVVNSTLGRAAARHGLYYAPDPSSQSACTLGGNVAENSGGPHCLKYGVTSRYISGLTLVLAGGRVVEVGGAASDPASGLDLVGLFVGSEGCFGMASEIEVRLLPVPGGVRTLLGIFQSVEEAARAVTDIVARGLLPAALEIMDGASIRAVEASAYAAGYPTDAGAALVVEFDGTEAGLDADVERAEACCREAGAREVQRADDEAQRARLWQGRKKAFGAMGRIAPDILVQDATVPRTRLPTVLHEIMEIGARYDLHVGNVFHAGDGNLHPKILFDRRDADELARVEKASREMMQVCVDAGGTITGEHGVGVDKRKYMPLVHGPGELDAMRDVRSVFDPRGLYNPGKVLPDREEEDGARDRGRGAGASGVEAGAGVGTTGGAGRPASPSTSRNGPRGPASPRPGLPPGFEPVEVVRPTSPGQVAEVLARARRAGRTVVPVGSGRAMGPLPPEGPWVLLSSRALSGVEEHEPGDLTFTAGPGTTLAEVDRVLRSHGQWLPVDPAGGPDRTLGGVVGTGAGGPLQAGYGAVRDLVLGLSLVTGDGRILRLGGRVMKNVAGFDLVRMVVGSRGRLGMVASVCLRVFPRPEHESVLVADGVGTDALLEAARGVATAPVVPASAVLAGSGREAALTLRLHGSRAAVEADRATLEEAAGVSLREVQEAGEAAAPGPREVAFRQAGLPSELPARWRAFGEALPDARLHADVLSGLLQGRVAPPREETGARGKGGRADPGGEAAGTVARVRRAAAASGRPALFTAVPLAAHAAVEPWDGLDPGGLASRLRARFDPDGVLSPGRLAR